MRRFRKKVRRFVRLYWFWVSLGLVLTKVSVEAAYIERGYKAYGGEWLVLPVVMIVGYFVNEARMYLPDFIEEWREEKAYERRVAENRRRVQRERNSPGVLDWISERGAEFVTRCTEEQKDAIAALLEKKMRESHTVDELARLIRPCIGLTEGDARANARYYDNIVATMRKEHPRMKIESIRRKALDAAQKYAEKQHRARAFTIAQTESAFAYNRGADEGIRQAQGEGYLGTMVKRWSTSGDDSVCDICNALEGTEVDMDADFDFKGKVLFAGQHMLPPAHPRCACAIEYIEVAAPRGRK